MTLRIYGTRITNLRFRIVAKMTQPHLKGCGNIAANIVQ
jgi:hypothetical protein